MCIADAGWGGGRGGVGRHAGKLNQMARFLSMQMTSAMPSSELVDNGDDLGELDSYEDDEDVNYRESGAFAATFDQALEADSDDDNDADMVRNPRTYTCTHTHTHRGRC
jgi:hypothetical protein